MKKMKLTYRNEIKIVIVDFPRTYFRMRGLTTDQQICNFCARVFMDGVKVPKNSAFGGKITKDEDRLLECSIYEIGEKYAGKIIYVFPIIS